MKFYFSISLLLLTAFLQANPIDHALVSVYAVNMKTGEVLIQERIEESLIPASCLKVMTTAAALDHIGENFQFKTHLEQEGSLDKKGILKGNLYIRGGGDPCLGSVRSGKSWKEQITLWANVIQKAHIKTIEGSILPDTSLWHSSQTVPSWSWEDLGNYYAANASALSFCDNTYSLTFKPGEHLGDETALLAIDPPISLPFLNEVKTGPEGSGDRAWIFGSEVSPMRLLRGTIPLGVDSFAIKGSIPNPEAFCCSLLALELEKRGIEIKHKKMPQNSSRKVLHTTLSPPLSQIVHLINQHSINLYADHLLRKLGEVACGEGSHQAGTQAVIEFLKKKSVDTEGIYLCDGSGLSPKNLVTTKQLVDFLIAIKDSPYFPTLFTSLPETHSGIRAKTGSMSFNRGLVGYSGDVAFAVLINHCTDSKEALKKIQEICSALSFQN